MRKRALCVLTVLMFALQMFVFPAAAEDALPESTNPPAPPAESTPAESAPAEYPKPSEPTGSDPTQGTTPPEPSQPASCTHTYGDWDADEGNHWKVCTNCGHRESAGHSWASETVTVDPTCGEAGGVCKICTVCQGVLVTDLIAPTGKHSYDNACDASCNVCGAQRTVEHTFGTAWKYSGKGHWHYCTVCGAADEVKSHYPGPAATEEKEQICLTCGYVMMKKKNHTHKWDTALSSDGTAHWYACSGCSEKKDLQDHSYDDSCDDVCNSCNYQRTTAHEYDAWLSDETSHWQICSICAAETEHMAHEMVQGSAPEQQSCSICAVEVTVAHEHDFSGEWKLSDSEHWLECTCGEKEQAAEHIWDEGREEDDVIVHTCEICQAEKLEEVPQKETPWFLVAAGGGILICLIGIVVCILVIRKNREEYV